MKKVKSFVKKHWKVIVLVVIIILILVLIKSCLSSTQKKATGVEYYRRRQSTGDWTDWDSEISVDYTKLGMASSSNTCSFSANGGVCPTTLTSSNGAFTFVTQGDGNLVLYNKIGKVIWSSNTQNKGVAPYRLIMQGDGNLVLYDSKNSPLWFTGTQNKGYAPHRLGVQDDGNLVIYDSRNNALWATNTYMQRDAIPMSGFRPIFDELVNKGVFNFFPFKVVTAQYLKDKGYLLDPDFMSSGSRAENIYMYPICIPVGSKWAPVGDLFIPFSAQSPDLSKIPVVLVRNLPEYSIPIENYEARWVSDSWKCRNPDQLGLWVIDKYINSFNYKGIGALISRYAKGENPMAPSQRGNKVCLMNAVNKKYLRVEVEVDQDPRVKVGNDSGSGCGADHWFYWSSPFYTMQVTSSNTSWFSSNKPFYNFIPQVLMDSYKGVLTQEEQNIKNQLQSTLKYSVLGRDAKFDELPVDFPSLPLSSTPYTLDELKVVAKKFAPMCILHKDENFFPSSVDWYMQYTKPVYQEDWSKPIDVSLSSPEEFRYHRDLTTDLVRLGAGMIYDAATGKKSPPPSLAPAPPQQYKSTIFAQTKQPLGSPTDILDFFSGERPMPLVGHPKYKIESRSEAYCIIVPRTDGKIELVYTFFFPYNWGKYACVGAGALGTVSDRNEEFRYLYDNNEHFRYLYDTNEEFRYYWNPFSASDWKSLGNTIKGGFESAFNTITGGLKTGWDGFKDYVANPLKNLFTEGCLGNIVRFGNHVGDIEGCRVLLNENLVPIEMYFGAHDFDYIIDYRSGQVQQDIKISDGVVGRSLVPGATFINVDDNGIINSDSAKNTHTVLYMARGSHGTWATPGKHNYTPKQTETGKIIATVVSGLKLIDSTSTLDDGIPWMTWKDLRVISPEEWSGKVPIQSEWTKYGVTNWITQVGRWGNRDDQFSKNSDEKIAGQRRLESGPSGFSGKYGGYVNYEKSHSKVAAPVQINDTNRNAIKALSTSRLVNTNYSDPLNLSSYTITNPTVINMLKRTKSI